MREAASTPMAMMILAKTKFHELFPGIAVACIVAVTAQFLSEHYATPAMLLALLIGLALGFLGEEGRAVPGIAFSARSLLRLGVAFLGVRVSMSLIVELGWDVIVLIVAGVIATILFGFSIIRLFGHKWRFALLTSGSVAICGASAAVAIAAILPRDERSEERLAFTVMGVTILSTVAMIAYPILSNYLEFNAQEAGLFLGGTIHDVAQVVGAGFSISESTGDTATLVKLIRVSMLAPVVLGAAVLIRRFGEPPNNGEKPPLLPAFVMGFLVLATLNSGSYLPQFVVEGFSQTSRWLLLIAIAAVGMKTNLKQVAAVGGAAIGLILVETLFIAGFILVGMKLVL